MEPNLLNRCVINKKTLRKAYTRTMRPWICYQLALALVMLGFAVYYSVRFLPLKDLRLILLNAVLYALAAVFAILALSTARRAAKLQIRRLKEQKQASEFENLYSFLPEEITVQSSLSADLIHLDYGSIKKIVPYKGLVLLRTRSKLLYCLDAARFENGAEADFWKLMNEKRPKAVPKKHRA